jgi:thymidine phosphorylase
MQGKHPIKWRQSDEERLNKEIKRFNAKIDRELKKHPEKEDLLPQKLRKKEVKADTQERKELNNLFNSINRFMKRNATDVMTNKNGVQTTKWEKNEIAIKVAVINRHRALERKIVENTPATDRGVLTGQKRGEMGDIRTQELQPKKFNFENIKSIKDWDKFVESVEKQASTSYITGKMELYKANYIQALENSNLPPYLAEQIKEIVVSLPADLVVKTYYSEEQAAIKFVYDVFEAIARGEIILSVWLRAQNAFNG